MAPRRCWRRDEQGAISVMAAGMMVAVLLATSLAVDVGRVAYVSRDQQGVTDRAALDAVFALEGHAAGTLAELYDLADAAVDRALDRNPGSTGTADGRTVTGLVLGTDTGGTFTAVCGREPDWMQTQRATLGQEQVSSCGVSDYDGTTGPGDISAVEVFTSSDVPYIFAIGAEEGSRAVRKRARASFGDPIGSVSAASTEIDLGDGVATMLLSRLLGAETDLDLVGWNGLANVDVTLRDLALALGVGSLDQLLATETTVSELAAITSAVLGNSTEPDVDAQATLLDIANLTTEAALQPVALGELLQVDPSSGSSALDASVDASSLLGALGQSALIGLALADGRNFATVELDVPGLATVDLQLIEGPQIAIGRPGKDVAGDWYTQARTAQTRVDVAVPLAVATTTVTGGSVDSTTEFGQRIDNISSCVEAVAEGSDSPGSIRSDLENAIDAYEQAATSMGLVVDVVLGTVETVLDSLTGLLSGLVSGLECVVNADGKQADIEGDLRDLLAAYESLVAAVAGGLDDGPAATTTPVLSVRLAAGSVALDTITCTDPLRAGVVVEGDAGRVTLTSSEAAAAAGPDQDPAPQTYDLVDLDLGVFGRITAGLSGDVTLGSLDDTHEFVGPFPSDPQPFSATDPGLANLVDALTIQLGSTEVLGLPVGSVTDEVVAGTTAMLDGALAPADAVLGSVLDVLGVELGVVEARVLSATCEGPPRLLANP